MAVAKPPVSRKRLGIRLNFGLLHVTRHWLRYTLVLVGIYITLPFLAPTLMHFGLTDPAKVIYTIYSPLCHQFGFRSIFLFGEQPFYPRYNTDSGYKPFESYVAGLPEFDPNRVLPFWGQVGDIYAFTTGFQGAAKEFLGDAQMGYKTALCERDIAIFLAIFAGSALYAYPPIRRRLRPCPLWLYVFLGLLPIGIDGFSQLLGYPPFNLWAPRETLPLFRFVTGAIFGLMNGWFGLPYIEQSMRETRRDIEAKLARAGLISSRLIPPSVQNQ